MIIQIRGTSGSGKSTVVRRVMRALVTSPLAAPDWKWEAYHVEGRKKPLWYCQPQAAVVVLGHYESQCGGCDTVGSAAAVYDLIMKFVNETRQTPLRIICEGLLLSEDVKWSSQLPDLRVIFLTTPLERCLRQIEERRKEAGNVKPLNPENTANRVGVIERARLKLLAKGVCCRRASADQAPSLIFDWLGYTRAGGYADGSGAGLVERRRNERDGGALPLLHGQGAAGGARTNSPG